MTTERYDIEIQDKISPDVSNKLKLIAQESRAAHASVKSLKDELARIDITAVSQLNRALSQNATAAARAQVAQTRMQEASARLATEQQRLATETARTAKETALAQLAQQRLATATQQTNSAQNQAASSAARLAAEQQRLATEQQRLATETQRTAAAQTRAEIAARRLSEMQQRQSQQSQNGANSNRLNRQQLLTLQYTMNDVAASLSSGASPFTILMQQGGQVTQAFGGIRGTFATFASMIGVTGAVVLTAAAAVGIYAIAVNAAAKEQAEFSNALKVTNGYAGITYSGFQQISESAAEMSHMSIGASKAVVMQLAASGKFQKEQINELAASALMLAEYTGKSADDVVKSFDSMARGPAAFAKELNSSLHFLSSAQLAHIRQLEEMGDKTGALKETSKALYDYLGTKGAANLGYLERAWRSVGNGISWAWDKMKAWGRDETPEEKLKRLQASLKTLEASSATQPQLSSPGMMGSTGSGAQDARPQALRDAKRTAAIEAMRAQVTAQQELVDGASKAAELASKNALIQQEGADASERLSNKWAGMADNIGKANDEIAAFRADLDKALKANPKDADALNALKNQAKIEAAIRRKYTPEGTDRAKELKKVNAELDKQVSTFGQISSVREVNQKMDEIEIGFAEKRIKLTDDERASLKGKLQAIQDNKAAQEAIDRIYETAVGPLRDYNASQDAAFKLMGEGKITAAQFGEAMNRAANSYEDAVDPLARLNRETKQNSDLLDLQGTARTVATQVMQVENMLRERGITLTKAERAELEASATAYQRKADLAKELDSIYAQSIGKQQELTDKVTALNQALANGWINEQFYKQGLADIGKEALNTKLQMQNATFEEGMLSSIGRITDGYHGMISGLSDSFGGFFQQTSDGFAESIGHSIAFGDSMKDALGNAARTAVAGLISSLVKLGIQYAVNAALGQGLAAAATAASATEAAALSAVWATPAALASLATLGTNSVPAMAAVAGTIATTQAFALAGMAGFEEGGYTGNYGRKEVAGVVHGQEFVMNAEATARNRPMLEAMNRGASASGGGSSTVGKSGGVSVNIENYGTSKDFEVQQIDEGQIRIIARDEAKSAVYQHAPMAVASDMRNPNSRTSKALAQNTTIQRKR